MIMTRRLIPSVTKNISWRCQSELTSHKSRDLNQKHSESLDNQLTQYLRSSVTYIAFEEKPKRVLDLGCGCVMNVTQTIMDELTDQALDRRMGD